MLRIAKVIENHLWIFFIGAIILGLVLPQYGEILLFLLKPALILMLFLMFLKLDTGDIVNKMKDIKLMSYLTVLILIAIPLFTYFIFIFIDQTLAIGFLLIASMPPGTASPALTDILKGNTILSMSTLIICSLLAPFTIPTLFHYLTPAEYSPDYWSLFWTLATLIFTPIILAYPTKKMFPKTISSIIPYIDAINVLIIFYLVFTVIATEQSFILANSDQVIWQLMLLYIFFAALHFIGYIAGTGRTKQDKVAITVSNSYLNVGLAIVLASSFFSSPIVMLAVLSEIPWSTLLGLLKKTLKYLK